MTWAYCTGCGQQLDYPTPEEIGNQALMCDCGETNDPRVTVGEGMQALHDATQAILERLDKIEERLTQTEADIKQLHYDYHHTTLPGLARARRRR
jgi:hypothetical protein